MLTRSQQPILWFIATIATLLIIPTHSPAQEKEGASSPDPIDQRKQDGNQSAEEKRTTPQQRQPSPLPGAWDGKGNRLIVIGPDGEKRELDTSNSAGVILKQSVQSVTENGEQQTRVQGQAVVIGPDGKRTEYDLAELPASGLGQGGLPLPDDLPAPLRKMLEDFPTGPQMQNLFGAGGRNLPDRLVPQPPLLEKYTIGIHCRPILDSTLRYQLNLDEQIGLIVVRVSDNSPAAAAGIQPHDILLYADQVGLASLFDLRDAVNQAGEEGLPLSLNLLSQGKEKGVEVQPVEVPLLKGNNPGRGNQPGPVFDQGAEVIPGFDQHRQQVEEQMRKMQQMRQELRQQMRQQMQQFERQEGGLDDSLDNGQP